MAYDRLNFKTGQVLTADALNHMEDGIARAMESGGSITLTTYADLVKLRNAGQLKAGTFYRITDYVTTTIQDDTRSAEHQFDVIILALDANTLSEEAYAAVHEGDTYFTEAGSNLAVWKLWYCLDNDATRFAWAVPEDGKRYKLYIESDDYGQLLYNYIPRKNTVVDGTILYAWYNEEEGTVYTDKLEVSAKDKLYGKQGNELTYVRIEEVVIDKVTAGKGVIYRMIDERANDIPYDFKNIQFYANGGYTFTFADADDLTTQCYNNAVGACEDDGVLLINNNTFGSGCHNNTFGSGCYENTFGSGCHNNTFGSGCYNNTFGSGCYENTFGSGCYENTFGNGCHNNTFGSGCYNNTFGKNDRFNNLGASCYDINFGSDLYHVSIEANCQYIEVGSGCSFIVVGYGCSYIQLENYFSNIKIGNQCNTLSLVNEETASTNARVQYYTFASGLNSNDTDNEEGIIEVQRRRRYETVVSRDSSGNLRQFNLADLAQ